MSNPITDTITQPEQYPILLNGLLELQDEQEQIEHLKNLCCNDLYFLLRYACNRKDLEHPWLFDRCREVQSAPDGYLDLWSREHYKSSIISFGLTIQDILNDPNVTFGIFSHTRPIAKGFLRQIKRELESNDRLKKWFPEVLWENPQRQAPKWSEDDGIIVKRTENPKESTVEAWGLIDGQPTSKHFKRRVYDDIVTRESVTTPDMIKKTTEAFELSDNLGSEGGTLRIAGTRYHFNDTYGTIIKRGMVKTRIYPCTHDGTENFTDENCVLMKPQTLADKRRTQGPYTFGTQMLLNPKGDNTQGFKREWITYMQGQPNGNGLNRYILVDPANEKNKKSDWTAMVVIGLGPDDNYQLLDVVRDRLNLYERTDRLFELHRKWKPLAVGYEKYGKDADISHIEYVMGIENYRFRIIPLGGSMSKIDRIRRLIPVFEQGRFIMPNTIFKTLYDKTTVNLIEQFIEEEYAAFPVGTHDDMFDVIARILDDDFPVKWPKPDDVMMRPPQVILGYGKSKAQQRKHR